MQKNELEVNGIYKFDVNMYRDLYLRLMLTIKEKHKNGYDVHLAQCETRYFFDDTDDVYYNCREYKHDIFVKGTKLYLYEQIEATIGTIVENEYTNRFGFTLNRYEHHKLMRDIFNNISYAHYNNWTQLSEVYVEVKKD